MAGIVQPIKDVIQRLQSLMVVNADLNQVPLHVRIWNNQLDDELEGRINSYPKPAAFIEVKQINWQQLGASVKASDLVFRIHLVHEFADAQDGTMDQDLQIFELRDKMDSVDCLSLYNPTACSSLMKTGEEQDFNHSSGVYHFISEYTCHFIDSKGSLYDECAGRYIKSASPLTVEIDGSIISNHPVGYRFFEKQFEKQFE